MHITQPETIVRVPIRRWRSTRFAIHVAESRRHRSLGIPPTRHPRRVRGSFNEATARLS
jgi:hypothetical protein